MIDGKDIKAMVNHWLDTPPNGYFAQSYGSDVRAMLLRDLSTDNADNLLKQLRRDIPILGQINDGQLSISTEKVGHEQLYVYLLIGGITITLGESKPQTADQDFYDVRAQ